MPLSSQSACPQPGKRAYFSPSAAAVCPTQLAVLMTDALEVSWEPGLHNFSHCCVCLFKKNICLFFCFWLREVLVAAHRIFPYCTSFFQFWRAGSVIAVREFSCPEACGIEVPPPGMEPRSPALEGGFLTTGQLAKSCSRCSLSWFSWAVLMGFLFCVSLKIPRKASLNNNN